MPFTDWWEALPVDLSTAAVLSDSFWYEAASLTPCTIAAPSAPIPTAAPVAAATPTPTRAPLPRLVSLDPSPSLDRATLSNVLDARSLARMSNSTFLAIGRLLPFV